MIVGYARVSTRSQNISSQIDLLKCRGCDKVYSDYGSSGKSNNREVLDECLNSLTQEDTLMVTDLDRLGRSLTDLHVTLKFLESNGITLVAIGQNINTSEPQGQLLFSIWAMVAHFEHNLLVERCQSNLQKAKNNGVRLGRKNKLNAEQIKMLLHLRNNHTPIKTISKVLGISRPTVYRYLNREVKQNES